MIKIGEEKEISIKEAIKKENERIKDDPNIIAVGYGLKIIKGKLTYEVCLQYSVRKKLKKKEDIEKAGSQLIPKEIYGIKTDVIQERIDEPFDDGPPTGSRGSRKENPLVGGTSTTVLSDWHSFPTGYGTLGGICFDANSGSELALSNAHVWGMETGKDVIQPWMPTGEYLEAIVKLLTCGPAVSYILDTTIPSPLTLGLAAAAAGAWVAAAASDAEDPSRWGQRVGSVPPQNARTEIEKISLKAGLPNRPFAGRPYSSKVTWDYTRETTHGTFNKNITAERKNENVIVSKRVWTERNTYHSGERVRICAEVITNYVNNPKDYFVVAQCFPKSNPERIIHRVLVPGECKYPQSKKDKVCFYGFSPRYKPGETINFPFSYGDFHFEGANPARFYGPWPPHDPQAVTVLRIPQDGLEISFPACSKVEIQIFHTNRPVNVEAYNDDNELITSCTSTDEQNILQGLEMIGTEITHIKLSGGGGEGNIVGMCIYKKYEEPPTQEGKYRFIYTGMFDLELREPQDKWCIMLFVQKINNVPVGVDPTVAAGVIGGIMVSDNIVSIGACGVVMLLDHVFDVI
ncbi:MAG: hypothetical protein ACFFA0_02025 [Promethearchaeota archaeon]